MPLRLPTTVCSVAILCTMVHALAEEPVRSTQEELRRRNLYFGDIDGRRSPEYEEAVKRYQRRKGFSASGHEDPDTLRSLGLLARTPNEPAPKELEWPEETVLKSDKKVDVVQEARELAANTGIAPESVIPPIAELAPSDRAKTIAARRRTGSGHGQVKPATGATPTVSPSAILAVPQMTSKLVFGLVDDYLHAVTKGDLKSELSLYADRVDYYGNGIVDRRIIEQQLRKYYQQWPSRSYRLSGTPTARSLPRSGEIVVTFTVNFKLKSSRGRAQGTTENRIILNAATSSPRIVSIQERRVH